MGNHAISFPTPRIAAAVQVARDAGMTDSQIMAPVQRRGWKQGIPYPPLPYYDAEPELLGKIRNQMALTFGGAMGVFFAIMGFVQSDMSLLANLVFIVVMAPIAGLAFGGLMNRTFRKRARGLRNRYGLPEWEDLPD